MLTGDTVSKQRFNLFVTVCGIIAAAYILINAFVIGGDSFVYNLNNIITIPLTIGVTLYSFSLWKLVENDRNNRLLWGGLMSGLTLWTIAEVLWIVYGYIYQEIPYPSPADYFWLAGYIPLAIGLYSRIGIMPVRLTLAQKLVLWGVLITTIAITVVFIMIPTAQNNDPAELLQSALNIFYPLADLLLLMFIIRLFFIFTRGNFGLGWNFLAVGFLLHSISNLIFSYASFWELYYPDLRATPISTLAIDVPYNLSYLLWLVGLFALRANFDVYRPYPAATQLQLVPNTNFLVYLNDAGRVMDVSNNFQNLFSVGDPKGKSLTEILDIPGTLEATLLNEMREKRRVADYLISDLVYKDGNISDTHVSGFALNLQGPYTGCVLAFNTLFENDYSLNSNLSDYQRDMSVNLRKLSESRENEAIRKLLLGYTLAYLKQYYNRVLQAGGPQVGEAFIDHLHQIAETNQWGLVFNPSELVAYADYELPMLRKALPVLRQAGREFASRIVNPKIIDEVTKSVTENFGEAIHRNVEFHSK